MTENVLVTGGLGFIGSYLVRRLVRDGHDVTVFDNKFRDDSGDSLDRVEDIQYVEGDIRDYDDLQAVPEPDRIFHLAAINGTKKFYEIPNQVLDVNVKGVQTITRYAREHDIERLVFTSSSEVYGFPNSIPTAEDHPLQIMDVENPRYSYAASKIVGEAHIVNASRDSYDHTIVRPHNIYGPKMGYDHVIPEFIERLVTDTEFTIYGDGEQTRAFCYITDAIDGLVAAGFEPEGANEIFNLGNDSREITITDLAKELFAISGEYPDISYIHDKEIEGSPSRRCPDISKMKNTMGYQPAVSLKDGLEKTFEWYEEQI